MTKFSTHYYTCTMTNIIIILMLDTTAGIMNGIASIMEKVNSSQKQQISFILCTNGGYKPMYLQQAHMSSYNLV